MIKKSFLGLATPQIEYKMLPVHLPETEKVPTPKRITLFHQKNNSNNIPSTLGIGDPVKTGEKLCLYPDQNYYVISPVTGTIASLSPYTGDFGKNYIAITITPDGNELTSTSGPFASAAASCSSTSLKASICSVICS